MICSLKAEISADMKIWGDERGGGSHRKGVQKGHGRRERSGEQLSGRIALRLIPLGRQGRKRGRTTETRKTEGMRI